MKVSALAVCVGFIMGGLLTAGGQTAYTDPVGVFKLTVPAGTVGSPSLQSFSIPLHRIPEDRGRATGVGAASVSDTDKTWTVNEFQYVSEGDDRYYVEFTDGNAVGKKYEIVSNTADALTLTVPAGENDPVTAGAAAGDAYVVVPFYRVRDVFGEPGNAKLLGGENSGGADNILLWNGAGFDTIYYSTFFGENIWRIAGVGPGNDALIWPGEGFFIRRRSTALTISIGGAVPVSRRVTPIQGSDLTFVGMEFPASVTLDTSDLLTGDGGPLEGGENSGEADLVYAWNGTSYDTYYYSTFFAENIWRLAGGGPAGTTELEPGKGYFIREWDDSGVLDWPRTLPYSLP